MSNTNKRLIFSIVILLGLCLWGVFRFLLERGHYFNIYPVPPSPQRYVKIALDFMDSGIYADGEEWEAKKSEIIERAKNLDEYDSTYDLLNEALSVAGGKHSMLISVDVQDGQIANQEQPSVNMEEQGILYVKLPPFVGTDGVKQYADVVVGYVKENLNQIKGVIIDLRDNTGGNLGPMLAAVSPFLPDGQLLAFRIKDSDQPVTLSEGAVAGGGSNLTVDAVKVSDVPVVILQNERTASSGEAVVLAFRGLDYVKTFGSDTAGYCSCNTVYYLYDGAMMQLTIGSNVARTGEEFCEEPIPPDVESGNPLDEAREWILGKEEWR